MNKKKKKMILVAMVLRIVFIVAGVGRRGDFLVFSPLAFDTVTLWGYSFCPN